MPSSFRINTTRLDAAVRRMLEANPKRARRAMSRVKHLLVKGARARAPKLTGTLVRSITGSVEKYRKSWAAFAYIPVNAASSAYAIPMHEWHYNLGPKSQAKQAKQKEIVGRKYLERSRDDQFAMAIRIIKDEMMKFPEFRKK